MKLYMLESYNCNFWKFLFIVILLSSIDSSFGQNKRKWCWTQSMVNEPSFVLDKKNGGMNWGYCMNEKKAPPIKYYSIIDTSTLAGSSTNSKLKIKLYGNKGASEVVDFYKYGFERGFSKKISFLGKDVGELQKIRLILDGNQPYRCKTIKIFRGAKQFNFGCIRALGPCTKQEPKRCFLDIEADGHIVYEVSVTTGDKTEDGTTSPILFTIFGKKGRGQKKMLSETGLKAGSTENFIISTTNVGKVTGFELDLEQVGKWKPTFIKIVNKTTKEKSEFKLDNVLVAKPGKSPLVYDGKTKGEESEGESQSSSGGSGGSSGGSTGGSIDINNTNGGLISIAEKKNILDISCDQILENPDEETNLFGPDYPTKSVNYLRILIRCPANCHLKKNSKVYGLGIHPQNTPICAAAIVDNAMSLYGGIFSLSVFPAYDKYTIPSDTPKKIHNIEVLPFLKIGAKKSFVLARVDNPDIVEKDIRILNEKGELSNEGRLEMRYEGVWGTICSFGNNRKAAKVICKEIGYKDGEWKSPEGQEGKNFCKSFKGQDYCGASTSKLFLSHIKCERQDNKFHECDKQLSDPAKCGHDFDAMIRCFNNDYTSPHHIPEKTVRLENIKKYGDKVTGRLELYHKSQWAPVCNVGYNQNAAKISCKQMGFERGKFVIHPSLSRFQLNIHSKKRFNASHIKCTGKEKSLHGCPMRLDNVHCKHDQDVVLICLGKKGDPSGRSQYIKKNPPPPPKLGKLLTPFRKIDCDTKGDDILFRGDPGSVYLVSCPKFCERRPGTIWGVGVYSSDSHICKAAIHSGVIGILGGIFAYVKSFRQIEYQKGKSNGILSAESTIEWKQSFSVSVINSGWMTGQSIFKSLPSFLQTYNDKLTLISESNSLIIPDHPEHQEKYEGYNYHYLNSLRNYHFSTFMELGSKGFFPTPVIEFVRPSFTHKFIASTQLQIKKHKIKDTLHDYTIIFQFKLTDFKNEKTFIFSAGGCGGFNVLISEGGSLKIGDYCSRNKFWNSGLKVPINDLTTVYLRYKEPKLTLIATNEKSRIPYTNSRVNSIPIVKSVLGNMFMGRNASEDKGHFLGEIKFFHIYPGEFTKGEVKKLISSIQIKGTPGFFEFKKTVDKRTCVSMCTDNPIPPNPGSGNPPKEANINGVDESGNFITKTTVGGNKGSSKISDDDNDSKKKDGDGDDGGDDKSSGGKVKGDGSGNGKKHGKKGKGGSNGANGGKGKGGAHGGAIKDSKGKIGGLGGLGGSDDDDGKKEENKGASFPNSYNKDPGIIDNGKIKPGSAGTYNHSQKNNILSIIVNCEANLMDVRFTGSPGKIFRVSCPNCSNDKTMVFGTAIFHPRSSICKAAQHFGALEKGKAGQVHVLLTGPKPMFNGSEGRDGNLSGTFSASDRSFTVSAAEPITEITCKTAANMANFAGTPTGTKFVVNCPKDCGKQMGLRVSGTDFYTDDSSICAAAIHRGVINDLGGEVKFQIDAGQDHYKGTNGFGISSKTVGPHIRSFIFLGFKAAIHFKFKETFEGVIKDNWEREQSKNKLEAKISDQWKFLKNANEGEKLQRLDSIKHEGRAIVKGNPNELSSWITLKNAEWANGTTKFNFFLKDKHPIAFLFRFKDKDNFYGVYFDASSKLGNIKLVYRKDGFTKVITTKSKEIELFEWYRIEVDYNYEDIVVRLQSGDIREKKVIFDRKIQGMHRGTIGFGTNGNSSFYINGIKVHKTLKSLNLPGPDNTFTWNMILDHSNKKEIHNYCKDLFLIDGQEAKRCEMPHFYCKYRCNGLINTIENVRNYHCFTDCVKKLKIEKVVKKDKESFNFVWFPKVGDKCDYKPSGLEVYYPCTVVELKKLDNQKFAKVEYTTKEGDKRLIHVNYPNRSFVKCGMGISVRKDCK